MKLTLYIIFIFILTAMLFSCPRHDNYRFDLLDSKGYQIYSVIQARNNAPRETIIAIKGNFSNGLEGYIVTSDEPDFDCISVARTKTYDEIVEPSKTEHKTIAGYLYIEEDVDEGYYSPGTCGSEDRLFFLAIQNAE